MLTHLFTSTAKRAELKSTNARNHLRGLLSETQRKNSETIADGIDGANVQDLQNFIADSKWDDAGAFAHVARRKKGKHSAGVARQYNGRLGKTDNCQAGVFSALSNGPAAAPLQKLAEHQGQRHFIERTFQNSKSHLGMAGYRVRKWRAWHRHMAMDALAGLFVMG